MDEDIAVKYFASLRDAQGKSEETVSSGGINNVGDVWRVVCKSERVKELSVLCAVNKTYASFSSSVRGGDEVAFFPPVTGG